MSWIKLSDKRPEFETLIELETEVDATPASIQAELLSLTAAGALFKVYYKAGIKDLLIKPEIDTYWQPKQPTTKVPIAVAGKRKRSPNKKKAESPEIHPIVH